MAKGRAKKADGYNRVANVREEKKTTSSRNLLTISFKDMDFTQPRGNLQSFESWNDDGLLVPLLTRIREVTKLTRDEAESQRIIKVYGDIPGCSDFSQPNHIKEQVSWAVLKGIGGQVVTLVGYMVQNTFYAVFLDKNHRFWPSNKKNT